MIHISAIDDFWRALGVAGFVLVMVGGLLHTLAAVICASKRRDPWPRWCGFHEMFHLAGTAAIATHYVAVAAIVLPMAATP
jgi:hemolysin III